MKVDRLLRLTLAFVIFLAFLLALAAALFVTESALNVWDRLRSGPPWVLYTYAALVALLAITAAWLVWRFVIPRRGVAGSESGRVFVSRETLERDLARADAKGIDTRSARAELDRIEEAREKLGIAMFGEISAGKSSLIGALLPGAELSISPVGGSTDTIRTYDWKSPAGVDVRLIDAPGTGNVDSAAETVLEEAMRSHLVVFVCDTDFAQQDVDALARLLAVGKPVLIALNKADRYDPEELSAILARIHEQLLALEHADAVSVVPVVAGGTERVIELDAEGRETESTRERAADISQLIVALNRFVKTDQGFLNRLRDRALFQLAAEKLSREESIYRQHRSEEIIRSYTKKAVVGALAAVSPGTDIVIQGYLGTGMTRELAGLYGQSPRDLDIEQFLDLSQSRVGKAIPLTLAVAGNGLKAFPGIGTVAGGLVHAVAYGLIFDALGRSLAQSLASGSGFSASAAAASFEASLGDQLERRVTSVARFAVKGGARE